MMIFTIGDIFKDSSSVLVNTVNCVGVMGKGVAATFKRLFPENYRDYRRRCLNHEVHPGKPYLFESLIKPDIINFPTKDHWRSPSRLSYIESGLDWFVEHWKELDIDSVAFPPLGCGNGGLSWEDVGPLMYQKLSDIPIKITVYAPYGTPSNQLKPGFLAAQNSPKMPIGETWRNYNRTWDLILYVIGALDADSLSLSVGRTAYQKVCYVLTRSGVDTKLAFKKGDYGPYSKDAKDALSVMANRNLITETTLGHMIKISPSDHFVFDESKFSEHELQAARTTIDLFSRIRDTEQAEIASTLLFAYDQLKMRNCGPVEESGLLDYVTSWKPHWKNARMIEQLKCNMFFLATLNFIGVQRLTYCPDEDL